MGGFIMADALSESPVETISLYTIHGCCTKAGSGYDFYLILNGEAEVVENGFRYYMEREDIVLAVPNSDFTMTAHGNNLILMVSMKADFFRKGRSETVGSFVCNSATDREKDYSIIRRYLCKMATAYFDHKDIRCMYLNSLAYGLLYYLNTYHYRPEISLNDGDVAGKHRERMDRIAQIIGERYMQPLSLNALAGELYLSVPYLSRFIKQYFGENFNVYLNRVRLEHAIDRLEHSRDSIIRIAHDTGFSSMNTFNRMFRERCGVTPNEYRKNSGSATVQTSEVPAADILTHSYDEFRQQLFELAGSGQEENDAMVYPQIQSYTVNTAGRKNVVPALWTSLINLGFAETLLNSEFQKQLARAQKEIHFTYGRVRCVLSDDMIPYINEDNGYNFVKFDRIITFLQSVNILPMLELNYKGAYMILGKNTVFSGVHDDENFSNEAIYLRKIRELMRHCVDYFGESAVEQWIFEIGYYEEKSLMAEAPDVFVRRMKKASAEIKDWAAGALVGGVCHKVWAPFEGFEEIVKAMDRQTYTPDFISITIIPYEPNAASDEPMGHCLFSSDPSYALTKVKKIRRLLESFPGMTQDIYITTLCVDMISRNALNDSCYQSSFLARCLMELAGEVKMLGYWEFSDVDTEYVDTASLLHGGNGLVSKYGIYKPGYFVLKNMARMGNALIYKKDGCIVSTGRKNSYFAVVSNYIRPADFYCMEARRDIAFEDIYSVFENSATKDVSLLLEALRPGNYRITITTLNRRYGSLLDAWLDSGLGSRLRQTEIEYLNTIVHTHSQFRTMSCPDGKMTLNMQLMPHEVKFISISPELG